MAPNDLRADRPLVGERAPASRPPEAAPQAETGGRPPRPPRKGRGGGRGRKGGDGGKGGRGLGRLVARLAGFGLAVGLAASAVGGIAAYGFYRQATADLPEHAWLADYQPPQMSRIYAADSRLMAELALERRVFLPIGAIPRRVQQAFTAAEDQRFWDHHGVDPIGIGRAVISNIEGLASGRRAGGASTITQQVAKNMLVGNERTMLRKVREAVLAFRLESAMPKERILEIYLNEIFLGAQAYGVAAAAMNYFNKGLDELTLGETAFLAALPKAPNNYNPARFPEAAKARRDWVLDRMVDDGAVSRAEAEAAKQEPIVPRGRARPDMVAVGQYFTEEVRRELVTRFGQDQTTMGGLVVRTSMEPGLQAATEAALRDGLMNYDRRRGGWRGPVTRIEAGATEWMPALEAVARPPGALPEWRLAVVLSVEAREARLGWVEKPDRATPAQPRQASLPFEDMGWARPVGRDGRLGAAPRRMQDVVAVGDVVLVESLPATAAQGRTPARPARLALRQVPQVEGAVVALDPQTGRVLAMAGGFSFEKSWFNRATQALRQPGSSFKPFVYLPALEMGIPPNQQLLDGPIEIRTPQGIWRPGNYSNNFNGWVTMRTALQKSLNLVTVRLAQEIGIDRVAETAARFHVIPNMPRVLSMALGAGETTVMRMAAAYASFANGGKEVAPTLVDSVQDRFGRVVWRADNRRCEGCDSGPNGEPPRLVDERRQVTDPIAAYQMVSLLQGVVQYGTGTRAGAGLGRPVAGKTGTTNDYMDNWFVGFTPDIAVAVWIGYDEPRSLGSGETGGSTAAPVFHDVVAAALKDSPPVPFRAPPGVALVRTQLDNGQTILEPFRPGTENAARPPVDDSVMSSDTPAGVDSNLGGLY
ncbi:penicillin-binding protein 1A [Pseudoroseomonas cervicalis]|uniref:penicillin-binding protein 1A n=1 Tax=Teichococcus cervicalis TaxID=204525 RepID=UPI0022F1C921|nr:PBP1A family penicillin-binding protein [Pseudoroseomonas cervicalis]WBV43274.1 PBP1A family penicillin-binding protein [Pseudoroseomonas cervicalis]